MMERSVDLYWRAGEPPHEFLWTPPGVEPPQVDSPWKIECLDQRSPRTKPWRLWSREVPGRTRSAKELRNYAAGIIGAEISDRVAARKQYGHSGTLLLMAAARLLRLGKYTDPEVVSEHEGE